MSRPVYTLLLVEDALGDREQYCRYLVSDAIYTYRILEAESAAAGLKLCGTQSIDAILLDSDLPDANGLEFLEALSARSEAGPPVVMIADGDGTVPSVALSRAIQAIKSGAEDYLLKHSLTPESLQTAVRSAIENAGLRQLRESDDRFRVSIENMLDCFGIFSAIRDESGQIVDFRFDYLNAAALQSNEMTQADRDKTLCEVFPAHYESGLFADYCRLVATGEPLIKENLIYSDKFGAQYLTRAYDVRASKLGDGFVASWRDVTAQKQAEVALQETNQQITTIWESMTDAYTTLDRDWRIVYTNPTSAQIIRQLSNQEPEEYLGKTHWEVFPLTVGTIIEREYHRAMIEQVPVHFEGLYEPNGTWFEIHAYPSESGLGIYFRDISDRKRNEEAIQQQLAEIESIYTTAPVGLCFVDTDLRFVRVNKQLAEINGLPVAEHLGRTLREIVPEMADQLEPLYQQVIASGEPILNLEVQGTNRAQPGVLRDWLVCYYPQKDLNQRVVGVNVMVKEITEQKRSERVQRQTEAALNESRQRFQEIFNTTHQFIGLLSPDGTLLEANQSALDFGGLTHEETLGRPFWEVRWWTLSPQTQQQLQDAIAQARQGEFVRYEVEVLGTGETTMMIDFSLKPVWDESGQVVLLIPEGHDITDRIRNECDRNRNEQRLRESEERLQLGIQVAGVGLAHFDYNSNTVTLSPEAAALYGIPSDELIITRDRLHQTFHPDDQEWLEEIIAQVLDPAGEGWFAHDHRVVWQNGEVRHLRVQKQVFFDRTGETPRPDYAILAAIDITDAKQAEATIQEQLAQIEAVYATAPIGLCFLDRDRRFIQMNEQLAEINGLPVSEQIGRTVMEILPELAERQEPIFKQVLETGVPMLNVEIQGTTPAQPGVERHWLVSYYPLIIADGEALGINIMVQEITDRKQAEADRAQLLAEAQAAREAAETANRSKDEFVAIVAHELRSPLNAILGWTKLLQGRKLDESTIAKALDTIVRNTQTQVQLIEDLLDIARLIKGTLQINLAPVNLNDVIEAVLDNIRPMADAKEIQIQTHLSLTPQVSGDFNRLQQIGVNLLTNAIKFTPTGGQVEIELEQVDAQVRLRLSDTGKGIAPEFLPYIFERFQQGQQNTGSKDGLGLGLAIVKNLVELQGGTITVESAGIGEGSTFTVCLPALGTPAVARSQVAIGRDALKGIRILAVDDEPDMLRLITFVLQDFGAEVQAATTATAALDCVSQFKPDILISDIAMPEKNGYELVQQLKSRPEGQIPAIALTSYASATYEERSLQAGFQQHMSKPVEPDVLAAAIMSLVGKN